MSDPKITNHGTLRVGVGDAIRKNIPPIGSSKPATSNLPESTEVKPPDVPKKDPNSLTKSARNNAHRKDMYYIGLEILTDIYGHLGAAQSDFNRIIRDGEPDDIQKIIDHLTNINQPVAELIDFMKEYKEKVEHD